MSILIAWGRQDSYATITEHEVAIALNPYPTATQAACDVYQTIRDLISAGF